MAALELHSNAYEVPPSTREGIPSIARGILLLLITIMYSGALQYLVYVSPYLLYSYYLTILACILLCLFSDGQVLSSLRSIFPYAVWIIVYCLWGTITTFDKAPVLPNVVRVLAQNILALTAVAIALINIGNLVKLANLLQVAVIVNAGISLWEVMTNSRLVSDTAYSVYTNGRVLDVLRPDGLWGDPNEAAIAFLFALLLSYWAHGTLAWFGRIAAIVGIYLTVSRSGVYLLLLCGILYLLFKLKSTGFTPGRIAVLANIFALAVGMAWVVGNGANPIPIDLAENWNLQRILDFSESESRVGSRGDITSLATSYVLDGPWYGYGIFALQGYDYSSFASGPGSGQGAHNIYLTVFGELGIFGAFIHLMILTIGIGRLFKLGVSRNERLIVALMWVTYLLSGFVLHTHFTLIVGMVYAALLYHLPVLLAMRASNNDTRSDSYAYKR